MPCPKTLVYTPSRHPGPFLFVGQHRAGRDPLCPLHRGGKVFREGGSRMKAVVQVGFGGPEVLHLQEVPKLEVKPGHLLVRVKAAGVNYIDTMRRRGMLPVLPKVPYVPGIEVCGVIEAVGEGVTSWEVGQRVMGCVSGGGYAEYALVPADALMPVPENLSDPEGAAVPINWLTAYFALVHAGQVQAGMKVLIHAAAGGVGTAAVQIAKLLGATVFATVGTDEKVALVRKIGADVVINYTREDFEALVRERTGGKGIHVVLESVGGEVVLKSLRCLRPHGRLVIYGHASGQPARLPAEEILWGNIIVVGVMLGFYLQDKLKAREGMERVLHWLRLGVVRPIVGEVHPLAEAGKAQHRLETRQTVGKVVLVPSPES